MDSRSLHDMVTPEHAKVRIRHMSAKMDAKVLCTALLSIALLGVFAVASFAVDPTGTWRTEEGATVRVSSCGGGLCATITALKEPNNPQTGKPKTDIHNVDPSKRNRPIVGVQIFTGLRPEGANKWTGQIYNPEDGKTYDANVVLENASTLRVQGCVLFICKTKTWQRQG
jgi:uncharacterized protein (DUF2147 family)